MRWDLSLPSMKINAICSRTASQHPIYDVFHRVQDQIKMVTVMYLQLSVLFAVFNKYLNRELDQYNHFEEIHFSTLSSLS